MWRGFVAYLATVWLYAGVAGQPTECSSDLECGSDRGFYCDDLFRCRRCLDCVQFKRNPPSVPVSCIKSVIQCGSCIKGLEEDRGDGSTECVLPSVRDETAVATYVWVVIAIALVIFIVLLIFVVVYLLRNKDTFKILASTRTSVQRPFEAGTGSVTTAPSAPDPPPPYYAQYSAVRPSSPENPAYVADYDAQHSGEDSSPFIKPPVFSPRAGAREAAGSQAARVYSNPNYVRGPQHPYGNETGSEVVESSVASPAMSDEERDVFTHDEDTMESTWTPQDNANSTTSAGAGASPWGLQPYSPTHTSHSTALCANQDTNNNRNASESTGESGPLPPTQPSFIINVVQNINALQQQNNK